MSSDPDAKQMWRLAARYSAISIEIVLAVMLGVWAGSWLDRKFDTAPIFFWIGTLVGIGAATKAIMRVAKATKEL